MAPKPKDGQAKAKAKVKVKAKAKPAAAADAGCFPVEDNGATDTVRETNKNHLQRLEDALNRILANPVFADITTAEPAAINSAAGHLSGDQVGVAKTIALCDFCSTTLMLCVMQWCLPDFLDSVGPPKNPGREVGSRCKILCTTGIQVLNPRVFLCLGWGQGQVN